MTVLDRSDGGAVRAAMESDLKGADMSVAAAHYLNNMQAASLISNLV